MTTEVIRESPFGDTIFCDDIRSEVGNKYSYMGVYRGDLVLDRPFPVHLAKFSMLISYSERITDNPEPIQIRIRLPGEEEPVFTADIPAERPPADPTSTEISAFRFWTVIVIANFSPFELKERGKITVRAYRGDQEVRLGALNVVSRVESDISPTGTSVPTTN